jgi:hypothetical protein
VQCFLSSEQSKLKISEMIKNNLIHLAILATLLLIAGWANAKSSLSKEQLLKKAHKEAQPVDAQEFGQKQQQPPQNFLHSG